MDPDSGSNPPSGTNGLLSNSAAAMPSNMNEILDAFLLINWGLWIVLVPYTFYHMVAPLFSKKAQRQLHWRKAELAALTWLLSAVIMMLVGHLFDLI